MKSLFESFPAPWNVCEDTVEEVDTVVVCEEEGSAEFPVFGGIRCGRIIPRRCTATLLKPEYEDQAFKNDRFSEPRGTCGLIAKPLLQSLPFPYGQSHDCSNRR